MTQAVAIAEQPAPRAPREGKGREPERRCIVSGTVGTRDGLVRFVVGPSSLGEGDAIVPDIDERLPGRGMWVTASRAVLTRAIAKGAFAKAAGQRVTAADDLVARVEMLLAERAIALVGLARRAGAAVAGYEKVRAALAGGRAALVLEACDAGADARRRLVSAIGARPVLRALTASELATAFGRDVVVHVGVAGGRLATEIERDCRRLSGFRPDANGAMIDTD